LALGHTQELGDDGLSLDPEIQRREALRRIPATAQAAGAGTRQGMPLRRLVAKRLAPKGDRFELVKGRDERRREHALGEDAFGHGVYRPENLPVPAVSQELDGLVVVELGVGAEEPVMGGGRLQHARELL
jgi:hypothetical protein